MAVHLYWVCSGMIGILKTVLLFGKLVASKIITKRIKERMVPGDNREAEYSIILDENYNILPEQTSKITPTTRLFEKFDRLTAERKENICTPQFLNELGISEISIEQLQQMSLEKLTQLEMVINISLNQQTIEDLATRVTEKIENQLNHQNQVIALEAMQKLGIVDSANQKEGWNIFNWAKPELDSSRNLEKLESVVNDLLIQQKGLLSFQKLWLQSNSFFFKKKIKNQQDL